METQINRRHLIGAAAAGLLPAVAVAVPASDADLIAAYDRFAVMQRDLNFMEVPPCWSEAEWDAYVDRFDQMLDDIAGRTPTTPRGIAVMALFAIGRSEMWDVHRQELNQWDGYSRPPDAVLDDVNRALWAIAAWGLGVADRSMAA